MYIYIYICICMYIYIDVHTHTYVYMCREDTIFTLCCLLVTGSVPIRDCASVASRCIHLEIYMWMYIYISIYMYTQIDMFIYTCVGKLPSLCCFARG